SLCEMLVSLSEALKEEKTLLDEQTATAFLTGIVSATDRFSNDHTTSRVMTMAAQLMAAGANQQLIAAKLEEAHDIGPNSQVVSAKSKNPDGTTSLAEGAPHQLNKGRKKQKKAKKPEDGLVIPIDHQAVPPSPPAPVQTESAPEPASQLAPAEQPPEETVEQKLARELAEVAPVAAAPAAPAVSLADDLAAAAQTS